MEGFFLLLYDFFKNKRILFFTAIVFISLGALFLASKIKLEEDITKMISGVDKKAQITKVLEHSKLLDKIIVTVSQTDTSQVPDPEKLIRYAEKLVTILQNTEFQPYVSAITFKLSESVMEDIFDIVYTNLPVFLEESDYVILDSLLTPEKVQEALDNSFNALLSPASFIMKRTIIRDPVGLSGIVMKKLVTFQNDDNYHKYRI